MHKRLFKEALEWFIRFLIRNNAGTNVKFKNGGRTAPLKKKRPETTAAFVSCNIHRWSHTHTHIYIYILGLTQEISKASDAPGKVLGQQFYNQKFENHVHGDAQFKGRIDIEHMQQLVKISELQLVYTSLLHSSNQNATKVVRIFLNVPQIINHQNYLQNKIKSIST